MKKKFKYIFIVIVSLIICVYSMYFYFYKNEMNRIQIIQEFQGGDDNYKYTYLRIVLPEEEYHNSKTLNAIKFYIEHERNRGKQNWFRVVLYSSWDDFVNVNSYEDVYIEKANE